MTHTVSLTITPEAAELAASMDLDAALKKIVEEIPGRFRGVESIRISAAPPYEDGAGPEIILEVSRPRADPLGDPEEDGWFQWIVESYPPEVFTHFCLVSDFVDAHAR